MPDPKVTYKVQVDKDGAIKGFQAVESAVSKMAKEQKDLLSKIKTGWSEASSAINVVKQGFALAGQALQQARLGEQAANASTLFKQLYSDSDTLIVKLREMTFGEINETSLQQLGSKIKSLGLDVEDLGDAAKYAFGLSVQHGEEYAVTLGKVVKAIGSAETAELKMLGLAVDQKTALENYAKAIGKTTAELTLQDKQTAMLAATTKEMADAFKGVDFEEFEHGASQATTAIDNLISVIQVEFSEAVSEAIEEWSYIWNWAKSKKISEKAYTPEQVAYMLEGSYEAVEGGKIKTVSPYLEERKAEIDGLYLPLKKKTKEVLDKVQKDADKEIQKGDKVSGSKKEGPNRTSAIREAMKQLEESATKDKEAERQKAFDMADEAKKLQGDMLAAEREYYQAKLQMEADALAESEAIKAAEIAAVQAERDAYLQLADSMGAAIAAITGSKRVEAAAIAAVAGVKAGFEVAESLASFATGNIPAGVAHAAAAVQYGVTAGTNVAKVFAPTEKAKKAAEEPPDLKAQSQGGRASMSSMGTGSGQGQQAITIVFHGDVVGPSGDKKWLVDGINKAIRQGQRISEKGIGKVGVDI